MKRERIIILCLKDELKIFISLVDSINKCAYANMLRKNFIRAYFDEYLSAIKDKICLLKKFYFSGGFLIATTPLDSNLYLWPKVILND